MPVSIRGQFQRSVHLARDFYGTRDLSGYIVTAKARDLTMRLGEALRTQSSTHAWSLTGPYGGGKSAFALFAAHLLRGSEAALELLKETDAATANRIQEALPGAFCPILVVGSRRPLREALLAGLAEALEAFASSLHNRRGRPPKAIATAQKTLRALASEAMATAAGVGEDRPILNLFDRAGACVHSHTGGGLFLVVDELGKLLEHSALYPERGDLFILQSLAERAARSEDGNAPPLLVLTILHQAFERYASRLSRTERDEWRKVQGRYEDVAFVEPVGETLRLLAHAIEVGEPSSVPPDAAQAVEATLSAAQLPARLDPAQVQDHLIAALPLHPAVALLVGPLFRRLAQNERSIFAFLASGEPDSFLDVLARYAGAGKTDEGQLSLLREAQAEEGVMFEGVLPLYRLDHLYDYLTGALGGALFHEHVGRLWAETESALSSLSSPTSLAEQLLKQIALLSFAGGLAGLPPSRDVLISSADAPEKEVDEALAALIEEKAVTYRPFRQEYRVWQGSDFDLEVELEKAREKVPIRTPLADLLARTVPPAPIVARRHAYRTGTTRVFEVHYANEASWRSLLEKPNERADGRIIYVLPEHAGEAETLIEALRMASMEAASRMTLLAVPDGAAGLRESARELACLDWVHEHAKALKGDRVARREVDEQRADLAAHVQQRLAMLLTDAGSGENPCTWIHQGEVFRIERERRLQGVLTSLCDEVFAQAPAVWNELLNRRQPSSSAVRGQKLLIKAMLERADESRLGIKGHPAEYGMYASVLAATGMHREVEPSHWGFVQPDTSAHPGCAAAWKTIEDALEASQTERLAVDVLFGQLRRPPLGVREGLLPVFLFAVFKAHEEEIAFFEDGVFTPDLDFEAVERLLRNPAAFALQWVAIDEARAGVLDVLAPLVGLTGATDGTAPRPLPIVLRILGRISTLPPFVRKTSHLSDMSVAVREALVSATEPARLLFHDLPVACGVGAFLEGTPDRKAGRDDAVRAQAYGEALMEALRELGGAYETLLRSIEDELAEAFHLHAETAEERRHELAERARVVLPGVVEARLKSFTVRAADEILDTWGWYESIAALLVHRPPAQWGDEDRRAFPLELKKIARLFLHREAVGFEAYAESESPSEPEQRIERIRLSVTATYQEEREAVFHVHREDAGKVERVVERLISSLNQGTESLETRLAALGRLSLALMEQHEGNPDPLQELLSGPREDSHRGHPQDPNHNISTDSEAAT